MNGCHKGTDVGLPATGEETLQKIYAGFVNVQDVLVDLNNDERVNLIRILKNLDDFHTRQYKDNKIM